jgi:hypothetical protein
MDISPNELLSNQETANELGLKPDTLTTWRSLGRGPDFVKVGRAVFYRRADLNAWLGAQRRQPVKTPA